MATHSATLGQTFKAISTSMENILGCKHAWGWFSMFQCSINFGVFILTLLNTIYSAVITSFAMFVSLIVLSDEEHLILSINVLVECQRSEVH